MSDTLDARCRAWEDEQRRLDASWISGPCPCAKDAKAPGQVRAPSPRRLFRIWQMLAPAHPFASPLTR
jgi:hypothetical protein